MIRKTICFRVDLCHVVELPGFISKHIIYLVPVFRPLMLPGVLEVVLELEHGSYHRELETGVELLLF